MQVRLSAEQAQFVRDMHSAGMYGRTPLDRAYGLFAKQLPPVPGVKFPISATWLETYYVALAEARSRQ